MDFSVMISEESWVVDKSLAFFCRMLSSIILSSTKLQRLDERLSSHKTQYFPRDSKKLSPQDIEPDKTSEQLKLTVAQILTTPQGHCFKEQSIWDIGYFRVIFSDYSVWHQIWENCFSLNISLVINHERYYYVKPSHGGVSGHSHP